MADNKKSFLLYTDVYHTVKKLTDEQAGKLFKVILGYVNDENLETNDIIIEIAFEPIKQSLKRDLRKYENIREKRSLAGKASADKRQQVSTSVKYNEHVLTNSTVNDNVNVSDIVSDNGIDYNKIIEIYNTTSFPKVEKLTKMRLSHLKARIKEYSVQTVIDIIQRADKSDFLKGKNDRNWKANFDFIIKPEKFVKILEGFYDNKKERLMMP